RERVLAQARGVGPIAAFTPARRRFAPWLIAAAALVVAISALLMYGAERERRQLAERDDAAAALELDRLRQRMARQDSLLAAVLSPDAQSATLVTQGRPPSVRLSLNRARNVVVVAARDLPPAAAGRVYQLWGIADGVPVSLGTFNTGADGRAAVALPLNTDARFTLGAITDEPAGGSPQPTTTPFAAGEWTL
ncbi:MAG: anti-sigma factor, partial [Gemmatimonadota bacterium]